MAYSAVQSSPQVVADILGGAEEEFYGEKSVADIRERFGHEGNPLLSSVVITNNIRVALEAFALGITCGIGTVYVLLVNGAMLGGIAGAFAKSGISGPFWMVILPHGASGAQRGSDRRGRGPALGLQPVGPGPADAAQGLARGGRSGRAIGRGTDPGLRRRGIFEGFVTPSQAIPEPLKVLLGVAAAAVFWLYLLVGGRREDLK